MKKWQFQEAKAKLSEVIKNAVDKGPQEITVRGKSTAIVISRKKYIELTEPKSSFVEFLQSSPLLGADIDLTRDKTTSRNIKL